MLYVEKIGTFVAPGRVSIGDLRDELGLTDAKVRLFSRFFGLETVAVAASADPVDLLLPAARVALGDTDPAAVVAMIHTQTMQFASPGKDTLTRVRAALGITAANAFTLSNLNCVAGVYAVRLADYLLTGQAAGAKVLVTTGELVVSPRLRLIPDTSVLGEAAAAYLVGRTGPGDTVLATGLRTLGRFHKGIDCSATELADFRHVYADTLATVVSHAVRRAGHTMADVTAVMPHNVNRVSWRQVAELLAIPEKVVFLDTLGEVGHCFGADPFLNLSDARALGRVGAGDVVVLASAGLGATFAAMVLRLGEGEVDR